MMRLFKLREKAKENGNLYHEIMGYADEFDVDENRGCYTLQEFIIAKRKYIQWRYWTRRENEADIRNSD